MLNSFAGTACPCTAWFFFGDVGPLLEEKKWYALAPRYSIFKLVLSGMRCRRYMYNRTKNQCFWKSCIFGDAFQLSLYNFSLVLLTHDQVGMPWYNLSRTSRRITST